jgi:16S rRNA G966 N2-methylase RsmD
VESAPPAVAAIRANLTALGIGGTRAVVVPLKVERALAQQVERGEGADVVFLDPPYEDEREYEATLSFLARQAAVLLAEGAVVIAEHRRRKAPAERFGLLERTRLLEQGDAALSFYRVRE